MLSIVAWALVHCNVCIDPKNPKFTEKPAISDLISINKSINKINILHSHFEEKYWNFKLQNFGMYQTCSFSDTISQKSTYLIRHYGISGFGWTYL